MAARPKPRSGFLGRRFAAFRASYVPEELVLKTSLRHVLLVFFGMGITLVAVPMLADREQRPSWLALALLAIGSVFTVIADRARARGRTGAVALLLNNACYAGALAWMVVRSEPPLSFAWAMVLGLAGATQWGQDFALTAMGAASVCGPILLAMVCGRVRPAECVLLSTCALTFVYTSASTYRRREVDRQNQSLRRALGAADQVARESMDVALAHAALGIGHLMHELQNSLASVRANLAYVYEDGVLVGEARQALEDAMIAHRRGERLVRQTLDTLRARSASEPAPFLIARILEELVARLVGELPHGPREFSLELRRPLPHFSVVGRREHLEIVLENLIRNAQQAGASAVTLEARADMTGSTVTMDVSDDGPGLPEYVRKHPFVPFVSGRKSVGLGLYLVRRYVELLGGAIDMVAPEDMPASDAVAEPGRRIGAIFRIRLPGEFLTSPHLVETAFDRVEARPASSK